MKISGTERKVLKILFGAERELTGYEITKQVYEGERTCKIISRSNYIYKILKKLVKQGIVEQKNSYPHFFSLGKGFVSKRSEVIYYQIQCPNCKELFWVDGDQSTKQCHCFTSGGTLRRFWLTKDRFTGEKKIV